METTRWAPEVKYIMGMKTEKAKELLLEKKIKKLCQTCASGDEYYKGYNNDTCDNWEPNEKYKNGEYTWE